MSDVEDAEDGDDMEVKEEEQPETIADCPLTDSHIRGELALTTKYNRLTLTLKYNYVC